MRYLILFIMLLMILCVHDELAIAEPLIPSSDFEIAAIVVEIKDGLASSNSMYRNIAYNLIGLSENRPFSGEKLQQSLDALKHCGRFEKIHVDSHEDETGITLVFQLTPFQQIKNIRITGASPLFNADVLKALTIDFGQNFSRKKLDEQPNLIKKLYHNEGFINPHIEVSATTDNTDGQVLVDINITSGKYYKIKRFEIHGNHSFSEMLLKLRLKTYIAFLLPWEAGRFIKKHIKTDIKSITEYCRSKGFADVKVTCTTDKVPELTEVSLFFKIEAGPRYDVVFDGSPAFWDYTLKKDLVLSDKGNQHGRGVAQSLKKIGQRYEKAGFGDTKIAVKETDEIIKQESVHLLNLHIDEGLQTIVNEIYITGNHHFDDEKITKQMLTHRPGWLHSGAYVPKILDDDLKAITALYHQKGFQNVHVDKTVQIFDFSYRQQKADVTIKITEGIQTQVESVTIRQAETDAGKLQSDEKMRAELKLRAGNPFNPVLLEDDANTLVALIAEKGYPHVTIKVSVKSNPDHSLVQIEYNVNQGPYVETGEVYFSGNFMTQRRIFENELEVLPGTPFSRQKILKTEQNIRALTCIDGAHIRYVGLKERASKVHFFAEIEEKAPYYIESGVGYDTLRLFYLQSQAGHRNLFGANMNGSAELEISEIGYSGSLKIREPRLFGSRITSVWDAYWEEQKEVNQDFGTRKFGTSLAFSRKWIERLFTDLTFRLEQREQFRTDTFTNAASEFYENDESEQRRMFVATPALRYDGRDSSVRPKKGVYSSASADISTGFENSLDNFIRYEFDARYYYSPWERLTLACMGRIGSLEPYGDIKKIPDDQLFFMGGVRDIRGYKENLFRYDQDGRPLGGEQAMIGSMEARIEMGMNIELTVFYDIGRLTDTIDADNSETFRSAAGLGLRYITPIGPIGFLYGFKLDSQENESMGRLYFSIGYTF
ncbi:outer membrane protein assembly factor BamA [Desulfococcaceae bacterium HSG9]|nr:outer membrane protein assembly factor BamA [Desulfococcaceae bacterium HSG9]